MSNENQLLPESANETAGEAVEGILQLIASHNGVKLKTLHMLDFVNYMIDKIFTSVSEQKSPLDGVVMLDMIIADLKEDRAAILEACYQVTAEATEIISAR